MAIDDIHHWSKTLAQWLPLEQIPPQWRDLRICHLHLDSRLVQPGDAFFALAADTAQRAKHIQTALEAGAVAIISDAGQGISVTISETVAVLGLTDVKARLADLAADFYDHPSRELRLLGVTGTNGKSTCVYLLAQLFTALSGEPCGILGTLGYGLVGEAPIATGMTTPDVISNQRILRLLRLRGAVALAMEVSSHGLHQGRTAGLAFAAAIFTNLTRDHLDYHSSMAEYAKAKQQLFANPHLQLAVINRDDAQADFMQTPLQASTRRLTYGLGADAVGADQVQYSEQGTHFELVSPWGRAMLRSPLMGSFNIYNLLACVSVALHFYPEAWPRLPGLVANLQSVPGRMERIVAVDGPVVVVDYAHTPDALEQALTNLRRHCAGQLWVVFGCGGDRDSGKRPQMAAIAERDADRVVITSDNPRHESPSAIIQEVLTGLSPGYMARVQEDRAAAIHYAVSQAKPEDWILLAGKGHEDYQIIGDHYLAFDDGAIARKALSQRGVQ